MHDPLVLLDVLERVRWNRAEAARQLGMSSRGLLYKIQQCGLAQKRPPRDWRPRRSA